jgi:hypothetical protein
MASAWLIRLFIDRQARFGFAADRESVPDQGVPFVAGRFDLAFVVSGLIGLGAPLIVGTWRGVPAGTSTRPSWQAFKHGVAGVMRDRLALITSAAHAEQFVLNGMLNAFCRFTGARF